MQRRTGIAKWFNRQNNGLVTAENGERTIFSHYMAMNGKYRDSYEVDPGRYGRPNDRRRVSRNW